MTERLDPSDVQVFRHASRQLAGYAKIMQGALQEEGFEGELGEELLKEWWRQQIAASLAPDLSKLMGGILGGEKP